MEKVSGVRSVDFKIVAVGNGVVNWNGKTTVAGDNGVELDNHSMPKLRGYSNLSGKVKEDTGYKYKKKASDVDFKENPLYISNNCLRHHVFKDQSHDMHFSKTEGADTLDLLVSVSGLLRGYVVPAKTYKRKSPLLLEDLVDQLGNGNFEQMGNSGARDSNSIFSKTTFGKTEYLGHGSISIEDLQFISLDKKFDRECYQAKTTKEGVEIANRIQSFIGSLNPLLADKVKAEYGQYYRVGSIYKEPECGVLLNEAAISILVDLMLEMIENLSINQAKGWVTVESIKKDYNNSSKMMRIVTSPQNVEEEKTSEYAIYYKKVEA